MKKSFVLAALTAAVIVGSAGMVRAETVAAPASTLPAAASAVATSATESVSNTAVSAKDAVKSEVKSEAAAKVESGKKAMHENKHIKHVKAVKDSAEKKVEKAKTTGEAVQDAVEAK